VELQEQLLDREEELTRREEALVVPEVDIEASKRALGGGGVHRARRRMSQD
jgi:hypothetical protein